MPENTEIVETQNNEFNLRIERIEENITLITEKIIEVELLIHLFQQSAIQLL